MLFGATMGLWAPSERVHKASSFWERVKKVIGPKSEAGEAIEVHTLLQAAALVGGAAQALEAIGVNNAIALVVDDQVLFEDRQSRPDDLDAMIAAMARVPASAALTKLDLVVEHRDGPLHLLISLSARGVHQADETTAVVTVAGRVVTLCPKSGEAELDYRERIARTLPSAAEAERFVTQFLRVVERLRVALASALPDVKVGSPTIDVRVRKPGAAGPLDAYARYCPEVDQAIVDEAVWSQTRRWSWRPPWVVIDGSGQRIGLLDAFDGNPTPSLPLADAWRWDGWAGAWS